MLLTDDPPYPRVYFHSRYWEQLYGLPDLEQVDALGYLVLAPDSRPVYSWLYNPTRSQVYPTEASLQAEPHVAVLHYPMTEVGIAALHTVTLEE